MLRFRQSLKAVPLSWPLLGCIILMAFTITGCATKIKVNMLKPAKYHRASLVKRIAVVPFNGAGGSEFSSEIEGILADVRIGSDSYFTLVERSAIDKVMNELQLSLSGAIDTATAAKVGKMVGAEGIYTGAVTMAKSSDSSYKEKRTDCAQRQIKYDKRGNAYEGNCIRWRSYFVNCTKRIAQFSCTPKLIDVNTGQILYSRNISATEESSGCEDRTAVDTGQELLSRAKEKTKEEFRRDIAPFYITREIVLLDCTDGIESSEAKSKLSEGVKFAGKNRMDRSCILWQEALNLAPSSPALAYNLGVCAESRGDYEAALAYYKKADKACKAPMDQVTEALKRMDSALKDQEILKKQLN
ncbi:MAG: hypothetical protein JW884_05120 [Deltaproteobacteria bacterium]|nr:hypothetical protein [Deltaproteobacteria bacterium]